MCYAAPTEQRPPIVVPTRMVADDAQANLWFGVSVALDSDQALIGATPYHDGAFGPGSAYLFRQEGPGNWRQSAKITPSDGHAGDAFGNAVALSGSTAVIGAVQDSVVGPRSGSAYVFEEVEPGRWAQSAKLAPDSPFAWHNFGQSVAVDGNTVIVGALYDGDPVREIGGSAYIFEKDSFGSWTQTAQLKPTDAEAFDGFGVSVAISGARAIVGAYLDDNVAHEAGSAYVFERDASGQWAQVAKLIAGDASSLNWFGWSVDIFDDAAIVGALQGTTWGDRSGSAYIFRDDGTGAWSQETQLIPSDGRTGVGVGHAVTISDDVAVVGALTDDAGQFSGSAFAFRRNDSGWTEVAKFVAGDAAGGDHFGHAVSLSGDAALAGAWVDDHAAGVDAGSVFVLNVPIPEPPTAILSALGLTALTRKRPRR